MSLQILGYKMTITSVMGAFFSSFSFESLERSQLPCPGQPWGDKGQLLWCQIQAANTAVLKPSSKHVDELGSGSFQGKFGDNCNPAKSLGFNITRGGPHPESAKLLLNL